MGKTFVDKHSENILLVSSQMSARMGYSQCRIEKIQVEKIKEISQWLRLQSKY